MAPWVAPVVAGIGALGSALGSVFAQANTNKTNERLTRETNALNYKMFQEQNEFNRQMQQEQNLYNLPKNQVDRFREAGLNPYLMMGAGNTSMQQSAVQSGNPIPMTAPQYDAKGYIQAFDRLGSFGNDVMVSSAQSEALRADAQGKKIDNLTKLDRNILEMVKISEDTSKTRAERKQAETQAYIYDMAKENIIRGYVLDNDEMDARISLLCSQRAVADAQKLNLDKQNSWVDRLNQSEVDRIVADTALLVARKDLTREEVRTQIKLQLQAEANARHLNIDSKRLEDTASDYADIVYEEAQNMKQFGTPHLSPVSESNSESASGFSISRSTTSSSTRYPSRYKNNPLPARSKSKRDYNRSRERTYGADGTGSVYR